MPLKSRACLAAYGLGAIFTALSGRLIHLGITQHEHYAQLAARAYNTRITLPARRGCIEDAEGAPLAANVPLRNVILDGSLIRHPEAVAGLLAGPLGMKREDILAKIDPNSHYLRLKNKIPEDLGRKIEETMQQVRQQALADAKARKIKAADVPDFKGIRFEPAFERIYPARSMLSHVIGFYGFEDATGDKPGEYRGIEGVERSMESWLAGQDGWRHYEKDAHGRELSDRATPERSPRHGATVRLTVNLNIQQIVESELDAACKRLRPKRACVVMMKPDTGDILALANFPSYDPNEPGKAKPEHRFNYAVAGTYEPGSTFKAVTCAGAINSRLVTPTTEIWCENGRWTYVGKPLRDHHPYGMLSVSQIIEKSSNIGAAKLAVQLGQERFHGWIRDFGFGQRTGIALPGEVRGTIRPPSTWSGISITRIAMGHEVAATPLQVTAATSAIANGGRLLMPKLVHDIRDDSGEIRAAYEPQEVRRVITEATAAKIRDALIKVTGKKGTASRAHIPGYVVAGKTGTAQKVEDGHYSHEHHITTFVGFVPAEKPAFCMLVLFDQAAVKPNEDTGGLVAAPVFRSIAERTLHHLGIEPDPLLLQQDKDATLELAKAGRD